MVFLRVPADDQGEPSFREMAQQLLAPRNRALGTGWQVSSLARAGEAKAHGQNGNLPRVVEDFGSQTQPFTKAIAAGVFERHA